MLKRNIRNGLIGAVVAGASAFALYACVPVATKTDPIAGTTTNPPVTQVAQKGQIKVAVELPTDSRQAQAVLDALNSIDLKVSSTKWQPPLTATIAKADIANNTATKTFADVPLGAATIEAVAKNAAGAALGSDSKDVTVEADKTVPAALTIKILDGDIAVEIGIIATSPLVIGQHGELQTGATYVGQAVCMTCHTDIGAEFKNTKHHNGVVDSATGLIKYPPAGRPSCATCHSVGTYAASYGSAIPYDYTTKSPTEEPNTLVSTITCEACHGPGSKHQVAKYADRFKTITRLPNYTDTCAKCHTGYSKKYDPATGKPVLDFSGKATDQVYEPANFTATGVPEAVYMAGGTHNALGMGPAASAMKQTGGVHMVANASGSWDAGGTVSFSNTHSNLTNGCATCHMANSGAKKHSFEIYEDGSRTSTTNSILNNGCAKCHGNGITADSVKSFQGQTKMAIETLKKSLYAYRKAFMKEGALVPRTGTATKSVDPAVFGENLSYAPTLWDDSDTYVQTGAASDSAVPAINWTDKKNWTDTSNHWSAHQKLYNQAYWNYSLASGEKSYGIHAPTYTQYLLRTSYNALVTELKKKEWATNTEAAAASKSFSLMSLR